MSISTIPLKANRFLTDFETLQKLGEGSFGEAFSVRNRLTGQISAVKKSKEKYLGYKDREAKLSEVYRALKITSKSL
jgi:serine/threonine protein kinase